jgi:hypothetical protein
LRLCDRGYPPLVFGDIREHSPLIRELGGDVIEIALASTRSTPSILGRCSTLPSASLPSVGSRTRITRMAARPGTGGRRAAELACSRHDVIGLAAPGRGAALADFEETLIAVAHGSCMIERTRRSSAT